MSFRQVWIPRLFVAAMLPSIAMVIALIFFPNAEISKCPLLVPASVPAVLINGQRFEVLNKPAQNETLELVFLGIVFDVSSGVRFYGPEGPYHQLVQKTDAARALILGDMDQDGPVSDLPKGTVRERVREWFSFLVNKYPQRGVREGLYWNKSGQGSELWLEMVALVETGNTESSVSPLIVPECTLYDDKSVSCTDANLSPKILRSRGIGRCGCVNENEIFDLQKHLEFVIVHFENCKGNICQSETY